MIAKKQAASISEDKLLSIVGAIIGKKSACEDEEHPLPPGPWDPVVRIAVERITGNWSNLGAEVALNPQPLPPRVAMFLAMAQTITNRAEMIQDIADSTAPDGEQRGIIVVGGYIARFVDNVCGSGFRLKYPFPGPRPQWFVEEITSVDLVVMASHFQQAAHAAFNQELRQHLMTASEKLIETGLSRI